MHDNNKVEAASECGWKIVHIPYKPPVLPHLQPTVNVYAAEIDPKDANILVRKLNQICPMENMRHVKRIRKKCNDGSGKPQLSLLLSVSNEDAGGMPCNVRELVKEYQLNTFIEKVCKYAASTKEEWEEQCKLWPTSFHPPTYNISGITGFDEVESQLVFSFMRLAVNLAKSVDGLVINAAIIVDPSTNQMISSACDEVISLNRSRDEAKESICSSRQPEASSHRRATDMAGQPKLLADNSKKMALATSDNVSCLHPWKWAADHQSSASLSIWHPLRHAPIVAIERSAARDRQLFPITGNNVVQEDYLLLSPLVGFPSKKQKVNPTDVANDLDTQTVPSQSNRPYLCTGYDIYLVWEPCVMCAMALVHQRVKRIFYAFPNPDGGALGSVHRLQGERSLNHHYAVFKVSLPEDVFKY